MATLYYPIIKLGESEIKALENSNAFVIDNINPIIEITRGRKSSATKVELGGELYPFDKRFGRIKSVFNVEKSEYAVTSLKLNEMPKTN